MQHLPHEMLIFIIRMSLLEPLGSLLGPSWGLLGASWRPLGSLWGPLGVVLGPLGASWERLGGLLGASGVLLRSSWGRLGAVLGPSWRLLGSSWSLLGPSWGHLKRQDGNLEATANIASKNIKQPALKMPNLRHLWAVFTTFQSQIAFDTVRVDGMAWASKRPYEDKSAE